MPFSPKMPPKVASFLMLGFICLMLLAIPYFMFLEYVEPNEFGIKEVKIGVNRGIQKEVCPAGLVFVMPYMQMIHRLPRNVQVFELTDVTGSDQNTAARASESVFHDQPAKIQTSDGFYVDVDVTVLYRIVDPYTVITVLGPGKQYHTQGVVPKAEPILKETLGELTTEEFYNSPMRVEKTEKARELLNKETMAKGIQIDQILVRYFRYSDAIQANIEQKKLQDQLVFTNQSKRRAATVEQDLNRVTTEGDMKVEITHQEGDAYRVRKEAERDLYVRTKEAEGDLLVKLADARRTQLVNEAMQELGADRKVALQMAEVLKGLELIILPTGGENSMNPLDLDRVLEMFGVDEGYDATAPLAPKLPPLESIVDISPPVEKPPAPEYPEEIQGYDTGSNTTVEAQPGTVEEAAQ